MKLSSKYLFKCTIFGCFKDLCIEICCPIYYQSVSVYNIYLFITLAANNSNDNLFSNLKTLANFPFPKNIPKIYLSISTLSVFLLYILSFITEVIPSSIGLLS